MDIKNYIELGRALQQRYDEIRRGVVTRQSVLQEQYKPLIDPLREISSNLKSQRETVPHATAPVAKPEEIKEEEEKLLTEKQRKLLNIIGPLAYEYLCNTNLSERDTTFGIYIKDKNTYLGNLQISIEDNIITAGVEKFIGTEGLWELLTRKDPKNYNNDDLTTYEYLVLKSSAHRHHNDPNSVGVKSSHGTKYLKVIKPMLMRHNLLKKTSKSLDQEMNESEGSGLRKIVTNAPVEYVYWNNLDELLERLYIVYGEIKSGNTNPTLHNELVNILQEIKEI